jgi:hypothetical protein
MPSTSPCPPPPWEDEAAVLAYVLAELDAGRDTRDQHGTTGSAADWQAAGRHQPEQEATRPPWF